MNKICLALIHNHNAERNAYIRPRLAELQSALSSRFEIKLLEVAYQPEIKPHGLRMALLRDVIYQALYRDWLRYRDLLPPFLPRHIASFLRYSLNSRRYAEGGGWRRSSAIEMAVTDKHIRAWMEYLDTDADFLICFEDDAVFREDSMQRLADLLNRLFPRIREDPGYRVYVDLAGGCTREALQIDKLQTGQDDAFRYYRKPVTNTACVYLISRPLACTFHDTLIRRPWLRLIGVDWMMNSLFMWMDKVGEQCDCMHADPIIFGHGSVTGEYSPWERGL